MKASVFLLTLLLACKLHGQTVDQQRDSMLTLASKKTVDSEKVILYNRIGDLYAYSQFDEASKYYLQAFELSKKIGFTRGIIRYYSSQGEIYNMKGEYSKCLELLFQGVELAKEKKDNLRLGIMYENIGNTYALMQTVDQAADYYFKALTIFESFADTVKLANTYSDLSTIYAKLNQFDKALVYIDKAIEVIKPKADGYYVAALVNKEMILWSLGRTREAILINSEIIERAKALDDYIDWSIALQNECNHAISFGRYSDAYKVSLDLEQLAAKIESEDQNIVASYCKAAALFYLNRLDESERILSGILVKADSLKLIPRQTEINLLYAKLILLKYKSPEKAAIYFERYDSLSRLVVNETVAKAVSSADQRYELNKRDLLLETQSGKLKQQKLTTLWLIVAITLLAALLFFGYRLYRNRQKINEQQLALTEQRIKDLEQQQLLNATQAILMGQEEERSRLAKDLHDGLGGILSSTKYSFNAMKEKLFISEETLEVFDKSMSLLDQSITELRRVAHNMMPESLINLSLKEALEGYCLQLNNSNVLDINFQFISTQSKELNNEVKIAVYRIVQELTNNSIKHAQTKNVMIQLAVDDNQLHLTFEDDGKGFQMNQLLQASGIGFANIKNRVNYLKGNLDIQSAPGKGTSVDIIIPLA